MVLYIDCIESQKRLRTYSVIGIRAPLFLYPRSVKLYWHFSLKKRSTEL